MTSDVKIVGQWYTLHKNAVKGWYESTIGRNYGNHIKKLSSRHIYAHIMIKILHVATALMPAWKAISVRIGILFLNTKGDYSASTP